MLRSLLNSETRNTNGAIKPCHRPSQNPATPSYWLAVPFEWLGPGAHPAKMLSNSRAITSKAKDGFIATPPCTYGYEAEAGKVSKENETPKEARACGLENWRPWPRLFGRNLLVWHIVYTPSHS